MGFKLKSIVKKVVKPILNTAKDLTLLATGATSAVLKPLGLDQLLGGKKDEGGDLGPLSTDPANAGDLVKPLVMPTMDSEAVAKARQDALLRRRKAGGRQSTILANTKY